MTTTAERDRLIAAALAQPRDTLALHALADEHDESGLQHQAALLRLAAALREVPYPAEPDEACRRAWVEGDTRYTHLGPGKPAPGNSVGLDGLSAVWHARTWDMAVWPDCHRWHGAGRLPGCAAAWRLLARPDFSLARAADFGALGRHVLRCELYSCGVIDARRRDEECPEPDALIDASCANAAAAKASPTRRVVMLADFDALWLLRGGSAGRAVSVMLRHEAAVTLRDRLTVACAGDLAARYEARRHRAAALALCRTYHRDVLRRFAAGEPWAHGRGVYETLKAGRARRP